VHRGVHLLVVTGIHLHSERRKHGVDALHLGVVEGANLALVARLNYFGNLIEVGADILIERGAGGAAHGSARRARPKKVTPGLRLANNWSAEGGKACWRQKRPWRLIVD